jgi:hypothetical protein
MSVFTSLICSLLLLCSTQVLAYERKVIIENNQCYMVSVDDETQLGTLTKVGVNSKLQEGQLFALPAGRGISAQTNPLAWDIHNDSIIAISFLDHPLNDRNESIKKIGIAGLKPWNETTPFEMLMQSAEMNMLMLNKPYLYTLSQSKYFDHFYFDGVMLKDAYYLVMSNNQTVNIWTYQDRKWTNSKTIPFETNGPFSLVAKDNKVYMYSTEGTCFDVSDKQLKKVGLEPKFNPTLGLIIDDRDKKKVYFMDQDKLDEAKSMKENIAQFAKVLIE